jgi:hypothetical protein
MRIPPSVMVMSLLTAVPFGLGIRDTLNSKNRDRSERERMESAKREKERAMSYEAQAAYEAEARRAEEDRQELVREQLAKLDQLYGANPAHMGTLFDGVVLGVKRTGPQDVTVE